MVLPRVIWSGDRTLHLVVGEGDSDAVAARVVRAQRALRLTGLGSMAEVLDVVPGSTAVQVTLRSVLPHTGAGRVEIESAVLEIVASAMQLSGVRTEPRSVIVPVCYGGELGPDLAWLAQRAGLSESETISLHASAEHTVRFLGFAPGFAYIAGLPEALQRPRMDSPRPRIRAGSVGIAGDRTGIYPSASPGGWRLIGATPLRMFHPTREPASLLQAGDRVVFQPISRADFDRLAAEHQP